MEKKLVTIIRKLTAPFLFWKFLPNSFGKEKILVTSRSDLRLLFPGLEKSASDLFHVVNKYVKEGTTVWDVGSNLGILTFCSALKVGAHGAVYSLEADPRYVDIQYRTLQRFTKDAGKISILCAAVADRSGILNLTIPKKGHSRNHLEIVKGNSAGEPEMTKQVLSLTLDWLLGYWEPPQFIKIDVEGAELLTVIGSRNLFTNIRPLCYIECAPENRESITAFFKQLNYDLYSLDDSGNEISIDRCVFNTVAKPKKICKGSLQLLQKAFRF